MRLTTRVAAVCESMRTNVHHDLVPAVCAPPCVQGSVLMVRFYEGEVAQDNKADG